eukprot:CAMPEP_0172315672 /NCGR_PEP_ID=MMETSP1058-20130122/25938_1 /TAXON_ID=83371 /ORGANISM="Detonula confervacea, Strain CCMP 353" /LENGTH=630 /DNA_ID=CAMNT_0013029803 /DNA_START=124 /DNA_END=2016 /DNA_ORIENTATION=+
MRDQSIKSKATGLLCIVLATVGRQQQCDAGWVDPDTPEKFFSRTSSYAKDTREFELVFSDEFDQDGRSFQDGSDPRWTAIDKNDYTNEALHFYRPENVQTTNGVLNITTIRKINRYRAFNEKKKTFFSDAKHIQSGMIQGWNKFCMTGGIIEFNAKLPGDPKTGGLWPALWMLGNLARATFVGSSNFVWPYSYNECSEKNRHSQQISACSKVGHYGMKPGVGRGSPEIDILEAMMGSDEKLPNTNITRPYFSTSLQIAPGLEGTRPNLGKLPKPGRWYQGLEYGSNNTQLNPFFYGVKLEHKPKQFTYQSDAISANTHLAKDFFKRHHKYSVEWEPPNEDGTGGYLKWFLDGKFLYGIKGSSLNLTNTEIPSEPMYLIMNTAVASSWGFPLPCPAGCDCKCYECGNPECMCGLPDGFCENIPASFEIDYVRVYQAKNDPKHILGCSTKDRPSANYITGHKKDYADKAGGHKEPLQPIQRGGGYCKQNSDCGYPTKGSCSESKRCVCEDDFTGPMCLSHAGVDDNPPPVEELEVDRPLLLPASSAMVVFAGMVFALFVGIVVFKRRKQMEYDQLPRNDTARLDGEMVGTMSQQSSVSGSYQQSGAPAYDPMGATDQNTVTYCVIDGRLLDE